MTTMSDLAAARGYLRRQFPAGGHVLAAVSGGLDSMCLLDLLLREEMGLSVTAAHFNHRLRGAGADRDEVFVRDYCAARSVPFVAGSGDTRALAEREGLTIEEAARTLRYAFLEQAAAERGCCAILTAHHADDNAETMLLNLIRGTGSAGLAGIPQRRGNICRPFLSIPRAELEGYAAAHGIPHVEDETNAADDAARNLLRHQVMPVLKTLNPRAVEHMTRTAALLAEESAALEGQAAILAETAEESPAGLRIHRSRLADAPPSVAKRAVLALCQRACGSRKDLTALHLEAVLALAAGTRTDLEASLPHGLTAWREGSFLLLERRPALGEGVPIVPGGQASLGAWTAVLSREQGAYPLRDTADLRLTAWRPSDRLALPGGRGSRTLKRLLADAGVSPGERDGLPVLRAGELPVAVPGLGVDIHFAPPPGQAAVYITFYKQTEEKEHAK